MAMSHLQKAGHKPLILVGGGTGAIGDPSGRNDMQRDDDKGYRGAQYPSVEKPDGAVFGFL